ncbi:MAG: glycerol-3-phosphate dehydrogenase/oxidase [Bdellovibrionota bacterium]
MKDFSFKTRSNNLKRLESESFDLLILGGGITGAGVARDAAARGLKVGLIEANDFAFGTSSRSSKLIHGGIRYLENQEFHLVFEALNERTKLFHMAPHLVHPLRFMIPLFSDSRVGMFKMGLGMWLYDALSLFQTPEMHERLNAHETMDRMPIVKAKELQGSFIYSDAYMDDDRLVHETLRSANEHGAVCVNYVSAEKSEFGADGKIKTIFAQDRISNKKIKISAKHVICSVGPWTDIVGQKVVDDWKIILRPTKGIHLTFAKDRLPLSSAVVMAAQESSRIVFAIPRHEMVIVGTTDTDFKGNPTDAIVTPEDVEYLLNITNQYFPGAKLKASDIISSYVGVRPLVKDESSSESKTSREHTIMSDDRGFTFVAGGKYTTYRLMAEQIVDRALKCFSFDTRASLKRCQTNEPLNLYTSVDAYSEAVNTAENALLKQLATRYGKENKVILEKYGYTDRIWSLEAYQAINTTMCLNLIDFYTRRAPLFLAQKDHGLEFLDEVAEVFRSELNLSADAIEKQKQDLKDYISAELKWKSFFSK